MTTDETEARRRVVEVTPTEKRAAQVRVKADQRSGRVTPKAIKAVAQAKALSAATRDASDVR